MSTDSSSFLHGLVDTKNQCFNGYSMGGYGAVIKTPLLFGLSKPFTAGWALFWGTLARTKTASKNGR